MLMEVLEPVVRLAQQGGQRLEAAGGPMLADLEQDPLRPVDGDLGVVRLLVADRRDPPGGCDQVASTDLPRRCGRSARRAPRWERRS